MLSGLRKSADAPEEVKVYEDFCRNFETGRKYIAIALGIDEKNKACESKKLMLEAAEHYKTAMNFLKAANAVKIMECPASRRSEVHQNREKADTYLRSAQDRFIDLTSKLGVSPPSSDSSDSSSNRSRTVVTVPSSARSRNSPARVSINRRPATTSGSARTTPTRDSLLKGVDKKFGEALLDEMLQNTGVKLSDVAGAEAAKAALEEAVILPALNPALFSGLRQPVKGILLFGPPGNGKTMLAKAVASEAGQRFFNISASSLTSKWVGDSEKTVRSLFTIARNAQPSIIFIDEIDSILCERSSKEADASRRLKTEFLLQFDGAATSNDDRILVIGATNRPHELDDAVLRRFPKRIMLGLPDENARAVLISETLRRHEADSGLSDRDIRWIASKTEGYSNSDLVALCKEAAMVPVRAISRDKLASAGTKIRSIKVSDFSDALRVIRPSTNDRVLDEMKQFASRAGQAI